MQSILIISSDPEKRKNEAVLLCEKKSISQFDITFLERSETTTKTGEVKKKQSIGIEDVKQMQQKLHLKPSQGSQKAVIILDAHLLTTEAQNALLKVLEEPPPNTILILSAETKEALLPTVLSRCHVMSLGREKISFEAEEEAKFREIATTFHQWSAGKALKQAEVLAKNKESVLPWLEKMITVTHEELLNEVKENTSHNTQQTEKLLVFLKNLQKTHSNVKNTNVNLRLTLETLFFSSK